MALHVRGVATEAAYLHVQQNPSAVWLVQHNLGHRPGGFVVTDAAGVDTDPEIQHLNVDAALLTFHTPTAGTAAVS